MSWNYGDDPKPQHWPHTDTSSGTLLEYIPVTEGKKFDQEKPDLSLLPREFLEEVAKAFMHGEKKYGRYNYVNGMDWHRIMASILRHATSFNEGEDIDGESGVSHLGHLGAATAMLLVYYKRGIGKDTRLKQSNGKG